MPPMYDDRREQEDRASTASNSKNKSVPRRYSIPFTIIVENQTPANQTDHSVPGHHQPACLMGAAA